VRVSFLAFGSFPLHFHLQLRGGGLLLEATLDVEVERLLEVVEVDQPAVVSPALGTLHHQLVGGRLLRPDLRRVVDDVTDVVAVGRHRRAAGRRLQQRRTLVQRVLRQWRECSQRRYSTTLIRRLTTNTTATNTTITTITITITIIIPTCSFVII